MSETLEKALEAVRKLSPRQQERIGENILAMLELESAEGIPPDHMSDVAEGLAEARRRDFAMDEELEAVYRKFDE